MGTHALIDQTVHQFQFQAVNRDVELQMIFEEPNMMASLFSMQPSVNVPATDMEINNLCVIVDEMLLGQVFRNVISNALKFTPTDGTINVSVTLIFDGLRDTDDMLLSGRRVSKDS